MYKRGCKRTRKRIKGGFVIKSYIERIIGELEKENEILEINMSVLGDDEGNISQMIAENESLINILNDIYSN